MLRDTAATSSRPAGFKVAMVKTASGWDERHGYKIRPDTLYPTLHRLEAEGLLTSAEQVNGGATAAGVHRDRGGAGGTRRGPRRAGGAGP